MTGHNIFLLPLMIACLIILVNIVFSQKLKYDKRFESDLSNRLYALSFVQPFSWFINQDENSKQVKNENKMLEMAGLGHIVNYRALTTFKAIMFLIVLVLYSIILLFIDYFFIFLDWVFRIEEPTGTVPMETRILIGVILLASLLIPKYFIQHRVKKNSFYFTQELPVIQLSIILMLRARRTMNEILYSLGNNDSRYKVIFQKAYRIYQRNKSDCWRYLKEEFKGTGLEETIDVLASMENYSKEETIRVLENGMEILVEKSSEQKQSGAALGNLFSQFSMAIPFGGLILLGAIPFAMHIFNMMTEQSVF